MLVEWEFTNKKSCVLMGLPRRRHGDRGFLKWWYPHSWLVYKGKSHLEMDDLGIPPFQETSMC